MQADPSTCMLSHTDRRLQSATGDAHDENWRSAPSWLPAAGSWWTTRRALSCRDL